MPNHAVRALFLVCMLAVGCSALGGVTSPPTATMAGRTKPPTSLPSPTAGSFSPTPPTPSRVAFPVPRSPAHRLSFSNSDNVAQTIYVYDFDTSEVNSVLTLSPQLSGHSQGANPRLGPEEMYLSPDGDILAVLEAGSELAPADYLHQIDLTTGETKRLKLSERGKWTLPKVPGRDPGEDVEQESPFLVNPYSNLFFFDTLVWSPDSRGFAFTLGDDGWGGPHGDQHHDGQMYYVERGSTQAVPLAAKAPGNHVGFGAAWSPGSRYLTYVTRSIIDNTLWLIDARDADSATQISGEIIDWRAQTGWLRDESALIYVDTRLVVKVDPMTGERKELVELQREEGDHVTYDVVGEVADGGSIVAIERHETDDQPVWDRQRVLYIDLRTDEVTSLLEGEAITQAYVLPVDDLLWVVYGERREGAIVEVPSGKVVAGPDPRLYPPSKREEIDSSPAWASDAFDESRLRWTPDMHLLAGYRGDDIVVWDVETGGYTTVAPELKGYKVLLGWDPTP